MWSAESGLCRYGASGGRRRPAAAQLDPAAREWNVGGRGVQGGGLGGEACTAEGACGLQLQPGTLPCPDYSRCAPASGPQPAVL